MRINTSYSFAKKEYNKYKKYELKRQINTKERALIVRLDGKSITKTFKSKNKCFDLRLYETMYKVSEDIIKFFPHIIRTYSFKDEISIQIDYDNFKDDAYYSNREEKLLSTLAGYISSLFNLHVQGKNVEEIYTFDARIIYLPKELLDSYFNARQSFATCAFFERLFSFYKLDSRNKKNWNLHYLVEHNDKIDNNDLKEYLCFGVSGSKKDGKWVVSPERSKDIEKIWIK